jgi:hypothetical protein
MKSPRALIAVVTLAAALPQPSDALEPTIDRQIMAS